MLQGLITELIISNVTYEEDKENKDFRDSIAALIQGIRFGVLLIKWND